MTNQTDIIIELQNKIEKLELQNKFLHLIADYSVNWEIYRDTSGKILYCNNTSETITGYKPEDFINGVITEKDLVHPMDWAFVEKQMLINLKQPMPENDFIFRIFTKNKELKTLSLNSLPIFQNNVHIGFRISIRDISTDNKLAELKIAKDKAEENERLLKQAQQTSKTGNWIWYVQENKLWWSDEMYHIFEIDKTTFTGRLDEVINETILPEDRPAVEQSNYSVIVHNNPIPTEYRIKTKNGKLKYVLGLADNLIFDENGKSKILTGIVKDITEYKIIQQELIEAKEHAEISEKIISDTIVDLKLAQQIAGIGNWQLDPSIGIPVWSDYVYKIYERDPKDGLPHINDYKIIYEPEQFQIFNNAVSAAIHEGKSYDIILKLKLSQDKIKWIRAICQPDLSRKTSKGYFLRGTIQDITDRKNIELELIRAKEKAEESDRLKTAFLQNMSHEIRTPLNAISGFSGLLDKEGITPEKRKNFVRIIQNSSNQLISIVSDILTISSLETRQEKTNITKVCVNDIIVELFTVFNQHLQNQNISLYAKKNLNDTEAEIFTDKTKLTQIISNLLSNAVKFTHIGFVEFGYVLKNNELEFYVKDTGIGINPEFHEKIFERFRQADKSINKLYGGTGLGLSISKGFVQLLGGKIWVQSEPEKGAVFYFTIPYNRVHL